MSIPVNNGWISGTGVLFIAQTTEYDYYTVSFTGTNEGSYAVVEFSDDGYTGWVGATGGYDLQKPPIQMINNVLTHRGKYHFPAQKAYMRVSVSQSSFGKNYAEEDGTDDPVTLSSDPLKGDPGPVGPQGPPGPPQDTSNFVLKTNALLDTLTILNPGSTGDVSSMSIKLPGTETVARTAAERASDTVQLADFGWDRTGETDAGPALRAAVAELGTKGGTINIGPGVCWINTAVPITTFVRVIGHGWQEAAAIGKGTWLKITNPSLTPFPISSQSTRGVEFRDVAVWQNQPPATGSTWEPTDYPPVWDIQNTAGTVKFSNIYLMNVTRGINNLNSGRLDIDGLYGQVFRYGVNIDVALDLPRIKRVHFWTYWTSDNRVLAWQLENADGIVSARNDNPFFSDIFAIVMRSAFRFVSSAAGVTNKYRIVNLDADLCKHGILVEANGVTGQVSNFTHQGDSPAGGYYNGATAVKITGNNTSLQLSNFDVRFQHGGGLTVTGTGNRVQVANGVVNLWDGGTTGKNAFDIADGLDAANANVLQANNIEFVGSGSNLWPSSSSGRVIKVSDFYSRTGTPTFSPKMTATGQFGVGRIEANGYSVLSADNPGSGDTNLRVRPIAGGTSLSVESPTASAADLHLIPKGSTGSTWIYGGGEAIMRTGAFPNSDSALLLARNAGSMDFIVEGNPNASINLTPNGSGTVNLNRSPRFNAGNTTGAASVALGSNSPATVPAAPYTWLAVKAADGTTVYIPAWK